MSVSRSQFFALKVLVSNNTAGNIIGKGGSAIKALQHDTGCGVKVRHARTVTPPRTHALRAARPKAAVSTLSVPGWATHPSALTTHGGCLLVRAVDTRRGVWSVLGCAAQLSQTGEYFPASEKRVVLLKAATQPPVAAALEQLIKKTTLVRACVRARASGCGPARRGLLALGVRRSARGVSPSRRVSHQRRARPAGQR